MLRNARNLNVPHFNRLAHGLASRSDGACGIGCAFVEIQDTALKVFGNRALKSVLKCLAAFACRKPRESKTNFED